MIDIEVKKQVRFVASKRRNDIANDMRHEKSGGTAYSYRFRPKHLSRWQPCKCKVCGDILYMMTNHHAQAHGYKDAEEMTAAAMFENIHDFF